MDSSETRSLHKEILLEERNLFLIRESKTVQVAENQRTGRAQAADVVSVLSYSLHTIDKPNNLIHMF